jgi:hypothetical protein
MLATKVALLSVSATLAKASTQLAQILEYGQPEPGEIYQLKAAIARCRYVQLAVSDILQPVPPGRDRVIEVTEE